MTFSSHGHWASEKMWVPNEANRFLDSWKWKFKGNSKVELPCLSRTANPDPRLWMGVAPDNVVVVPRVPGV